MKIQMISILLGLLTLTLQMKSQVIFEEIGIQDILQKAKSENKLVFLDCYTSWCGPCKKMLKEVFSREDVGEYMNTHFVNFKKDMEKGEGKELAKAYGVEVYPTFFILDAEGKVRHKMVGGMTAEEFLQQVRKGGGENSLYAFTCRYQQGDRTPQFITDYIESLADAYMKEDMKRVLEEYWDTLDEQAKCSATTWPLLKRFVWDVKSPAYQYLLDHKSDFETTVGKEAVDAKLSGDLLPLIGNHCNDMIFKNRPEDSKALEEYRQLVEKAGVQRQEYLLELIRFTQTYVDNDLSTALKIYKRDFSKLSTDDRFGVTLQLNGMLIGKGTPSQCKQGLKAIQKTIKECEWEEHNPMFEAITKGLKSKFESDNNSNKL